MVVSIQNLLGFSKKSHSLDLDSLPWFLLPVANLWIHVNQRYGKGIQEELGAEEEVYENMFIILTTKLRRLRWPKSSKKIAKPQKCEHGGHQERMR